MKGMFWTKKAVWFSLAIVLGIGLGKICWRFTPIDWKVDKDTRYFLAIGEAIEKQKRGEIEQSKAILMSAIRLRTNYYDAYLLMGELLLTSGMTNEAVRYYEAALSRCGSTPTNFLPASTQGCERERIIRKIGTLKQ